MGFLGKLFRVWGSAGDRVEAELNGFADDVRELRCVFRERMGLGPIDGREALPPVGDDCDQGGEPEAAGAGRNGRRRKG